MSVKCPECKSEHISKNGKNKQDKQKYICVDCSRQFILDYEPHKGYSQVGELDELETFIGKKK